MNAMPASVEGMMSGRDANGRIKTMTGIRIVPALWVVLFHYRAHSGDLDHPLALLIRTGKLAVPMFFILSGFILSHAYRPYFDRLSWREIRNFILYRLARIYPAYAAGIFLVALLFFLPVPVEPGVYTPFTLGMNILMIQSWGTVETSSWNAPGWSISSEWLAYLAFPVLFMVVKRLDARLCLALALALPLVTSSIELTREEQMASFAIRTFTLGMLFCSGSLMWKGLCHVTPNARYDWLALGAMCAIFPLAWFDLKYAYDWWYTDYAHGYFVFIAMGICIFALANSQGFMIAMVGNPAAVFLGEISYSLYIIHQPAKLYLRHALGGMQPLWAEIGVALLAAIALHYAVERPGRRAIQAVARHVDRR